MLVEVSSKTMTKKVIDRGRRNETLNEVKPIKNINKNCRVF